MRSRSGDAFPMAVQFGHVEELIHTWGAKGLFEEGEFKFSQGNTPWCLRRKNPGAGLGMLKGRSLLVHQVSDWCSGAAVNFGWMREAKREKPAVVFDR